MGFLAFARNSVARSCGLGLTTYITDGTSWDVVAHFQLLDLQLWTNLTL
jgi:hypothetical protein